MRNPHDRRQPPLPHEWSRAFRSSQHEQTDPLANAHRDYPSTGTYEICRDQYGQNVQENWGARPINQRPRRQNPVFRGHHRPIETSLLDHPISGNRGYDNSGTGEDFYIMVAYSFAAVSVTFALCMIFL